MPPRFIPNRRAHMYRVAFDMYSTHIFTNFFIFLNCYCSFYLKLADMTLKLFKIKQPFIWLDDYPAYNELVTLLILMISSIFSKIYKIIKVDQHSLRQEDYPEYNEIVTLVKWTGKNKQISHGEFNQRLKRWSHRESIRFTRLLLEGLDTFMRKSHTTGCQSATYRRDKDFIATKKIPVGFLALFFFLCLSRCFLPLNGIGPAYSSDISGDGPPMDRDRDKTPRLPNVAEPKRTIPLEIQEATAKFLRQQDERKQAPNTMPLEIQEATANYLRQQEERRQAARDRTAAAAEKRRKKAEEADEKRSKKAEPAATRQLQSRSKKTVEEKSAIQERNTEARREARSQLSADAKDDIQAKDNAAHQLRVANMSPPEVAVFHAANAESQERRRLNMTPQEKADEKVRNAEAHQEAVANMTQPERTQPSTRTKE